MKFEPGDVVKLNSGGPMMTVEQVGNTYDEDAVSCAWFETVANKRIAQKETFKAAALSKN